MPPTIYRKKSEKPTRTTALIAALVVSRYNRSWLSAPVSELLGAGDPGIQRLSRLKARLLGPMENWVREATRRGRPPKEPSLAERVEILEAVLAIAASLIPHAPQRKRHLGERLVCSFERLQQSHALPVRSFCRMLGLSERTFRSWRSRPAVREGEPEKIPVPRKKRRTRERSGRFDLFHLVPGIWAMADTTDIRVLGVPLKLIALQDPGRRTSRIFEGLGVYTRERAREVVALVTKTLSKVPGTQLLTDQGTPYLAELARESYERLELDHVPQREGTPTDKSPLERAFGTLKEVVRPLFELTNHLAEVLPQLRDPQLAQRVGELLMTVFLRTYVIAARDSSHPLGKTDVHQLSLIAEEQREAARREESSRRLLLSQIHDAYAMEGSRERFVGAHRRHALEDIQEAERIIRESACRCLTRACDRYFAAVLRDVAERGRARRRRVRNEKLERERRKAECREVDSQREFFLAHPELSFTRGLDLLSCQWNSREGELIALGAGLGRLWVREAVELLAQKNPRTFEDDVGALLKSWRENHSTFDPRGVKAICDLVGEIVTEKRAREKAPSIHEGIGALLKGSFAPAMER